MSEEREREELDVDETILQSSFTGYTSKLTDRQTGRFYAFVDFNENDIGRIRKCRHCLEYEIHNKLQPRILEKGQAKPPDYDQFIQCYTCGNTFAIHETFTESKIKDSVQTTDNPFENESTFLSIDSRATQRRKGKKHKGRFSYKEQEDPDIHTEIEKYGSDNVRIIQ